MFISQRSPEHSLHSLGGYFSSLMSSTDFGLCHVRVEWIVTLLAQNIFAEQAMTLYVLNSKILCCLIKFPGFNTNCTYSEEKQRQLRR